MCGIVGIAGVTPQTRDWLVAGRDVMAHRGPDDAGAWWSADGRVGLAQRRLAIIDLSPGGHQPMHDASGDLSIVYNGEIYNFAELRAELAAEGAVFVSHSDTEVILAAYRKWGVDCLARLNGMFALALYDARRRTVLLARDRSGEKPLFYSLDDGALRFASELKALMADATLARRVDREALDCYLAMGFVPGERCILQGVRKLPPAHALEFILESGKSRTWRYWDIPQAQGEAGVDEDALLDELESLLGAAVQRQLVADVPVGVLLSGGVDSSIVTALAARGRSQIKTFTVGFPGHGKLDETQHARLIARHFGTEHLDLMAEPTTADLLPRLARQYDEPMNDSSMIPTFLVSQMVRQKCTVAVGGDGGDELFGGYSHYSRLARLHGMAGPVPRPLRRVLSWGAERFLPPGAKGRNYMIAAGADFAHSTPLLALYFDATTRRRLMGEDWSLVAEAEHERVVAPGSDLLDRAMRTDFKTYLPEDILVKVDRASMLTSLEVRAPFLDRAVVEFAYSKVPTRLKAGARQRKVLLKRLASRLLPREFDTQRKQGFSIPLKFWLEEGAFRDLFRDVLLAGDCAFNRGAVQGLLDGQAKGRDNSERLFGLVMFELWRHEYRVQV
jgi:asparagine synthase (glutamine-hydrolysing)